MARALRSVKTFKKSWDSDKALKSTYQGKVGKHQLRAYIFLVLGYAVVVAWLAEMPAFACKDTDMDCFSAQRDPCQWNSFSIASQMDRLWQPYSQSIKYLIARDESSSDNASTSNNRSFSEQYYWTVEPQRTQGETCDSV